MSKEQRIDQGEGREAEPVAPPTWVYAEGLGVNERRPNFVNRRGEFCLVRCFVCAPDGGRENYALAVGLGRCAWCGAGRDNAEIPA